MTYRTRGTCSRDVTVELDDNGTIVSAVFNGGCAGNTAGISRLVVGMDAKEAIARLKGVRCGLKSTSCPDQLALALEQCLSEQ
ncbi:MAG: TIGR03905 family TSCPD domain-containing protein [Clostridia bacterium]|nr:TIGR03905 family TSCPD domain-containing protein [Clostridia bacterium]